MDLVNYRLVKIVGGVQVKEEVYPSLDELCKNQLEALDFDDLTYCSEEEIAKADEGQAIAPPTLTKEEKPKPRTISVFHPEIPMSERLDFDLTANEVSEAGKKERFRRNIMAIQLLKTCENENRLATAEEQKILSQYAGFGGIPEAFDESNDAWRTEYLELSTVLTPEEYTVARESTLTAFYTPNVVIQAMYQALGIYTFKLFVDQQPSFWSVLIYLSLFVKRSFCLYISDRNYSLTVYISNLFAVSVPFSNILWQGTTR